MSILIKGMEMPNSCRDCPISGEWYCNALPSIPAWHKEYVASIEDQTRMDRCPLVPVPPHGRLIDADALLSQYKGNIWTAKTDYAEGLRDVANDIKNAPTIIEAEEEES